MKTKWILPLLLLTATFTASAQGEDEGELIIEDYSQAGTITNEPIQDERYTVNHVHEFDVIDINVNQLVGADLLTLGGEYSFSFDISNRLPADMGQYVAISDVMSECFCINPGFQTTPVAPGRSTGISVRLEAGARGSFSSMMTVTLSDPSGLRPVAIQRVRLNFQVQ